MKLSTDDLKDIDSAVDAVRDRLHPEDRFDLRQDLTIKLLVRRARPTSVRAWARESAFNWAARASRDALLSREILKELHLSGGVGRGYRKGPNWEPEWFPPHPNASEGDWLACAGARLMRVKPAQVTHRDEEKKMAQMLDSKGVWRSGKRK